MNLLDGDLFLLLPLTIIPLAVILLGLSAIILWELVGPRSIRVLWEPRDLWVGVHWRRNTEPDRDSILRPQFRRSLPRLDVWVCFLPCVPVHLVFGTRWARRPRTRLPLIPCCCPGARAGHHDSECPVPHVEGCHG